MSSDTPRPGDTFPTNPTIKVDYPAVPNTVEVKDGQGLRARLV